MTEKDANKSRDQHRSFWETACQKFMQRLIAYALRLANGRVYDAEDLVQGTVLRALLYGKNPQEIRSPFGYLLSIMRSIWITQWHKDRTADTDSLDELLNKEGQQHQHRSVEPAVESDVLQILENDELRAEIRAKQGPLTPREELLLALYLEGYKCQEIADKLKMDVGLVRLELNRMRTKVRNRLIKAKR